MKSFKRIAIYCGSSDRVDPAYLQLATQVGKTLAERGIGVVYGGGRVGLMGAVADAALAAGGEVIGVIPRRLKGLEVGHTELTETHVVDGMPLRKSMMIHLSDAFIALPGGFGTWEEILEAATQAMLNYHTKPLGVLNLNGYYDPLQAMIDRAVEERFVRALHHELVVFEPTLDVLLERLSQVEIPLMAQWVGDLK